MTSDAQDAPQDPSVDAQTPPEGDGLSHAWGRVDQDRTVYVRTADGERSVGQFPDETPEAALTFFTERFAALEFEVQLLEQRVRAGKLSPEEATASTKAVREQVVDANAVGDLAGLAARLDSLGPVIAGQREQRRAERAAKTAEAKAAKEEIVAAAEKIATSRDWRNGANRMRELLERWKALPRIDKPSDDALWHRFSGARTSFTKVRKAHFAEQDEKRSAAQAVKERLATKAEALATSTDWGATAGEYRDLMREWKAAGPAPRDVDETLWQRFRGAQDTFFAARDAENAKVDEEFAVNAEVKRALLVEAEALLPVTDLDAAKRAFRDLADRWDAAGKVPRDQMKELEARIRKVEQEIRSVEDQQWTRTDPEKSARADDMIGKFQAAIDKAEADLEKARTAGDERKVKDLEGSLASQRALLDMALRARSDYTG